MNFSLPTIQPGHYVHKGGGHYTVLFVGRNSTNKDEGSTMVPHFADGLLREVHGRHEPDVLSDHGMEYPVRERLPVPVIIIDRLPARVVFVDEYKVDHAAFRRSRFFSM